MAKEAIPFKPTQPPAGSPEAPPATELTPEQGQQIQGLRKLIGEAITQSAAPLVERIQELEERIPRPEPKAPETPEGEEPSEDDYYRSPLPTTRSIAESTTRKALEQATPQIRAGIDAAIRVNEMEMAEKDPDFLLLREEYRQEAEAIRNTHPEMLAASNFNETGKSGVEQLFARVKGLHIDTLLERRGERASADEEPQPTRRHAPYTERATPRQERARAPSDKLDDEEKKVAERMGMSHEEYVQWREMRNQRPDDLPPGI